MSTKISSYRSWNTAPNPSETMDDADIRAGFEKALVKYNGACRQFHISIAGYPVRIRVVGDALADDIGRAFAHIEINNPDKISLSIDIWDQHETGIGIIPNSTQPNSELPVQTFLKASEDGRFVCEERDQGVLWLDRGAHRIVGYTASADERYLDERARPFHRLLSCWLHDRGIQFIHSGLVALNNRGVLFVGNGGVGKSTSSIACLRAGFKFLGDDFIGLQAMDNGDFTGYGLFASCLLNVDHLKRFPDLRQTALPAYHAHEEKSVIYLSGAFDDRLEHRVNIRALALPRVVDAEQTSIRPATKKEALLALAPTSVMFLPSPSARALDKLAQLVERVPSFWLELGRDINQIPDVVEKLLAQVYEP